jgi:hypothetical protein
MPVIATKFTSYASFANATLEEVYGEADLKDAYSRGAVTFESILLLATPDGSFSISALASKAQQFPLLEALFEDLNGDGNPDALVAGCIYETEVETPRLDGGHGLALLSDGKGGYHAGSCPTYCLYIPGNVKSLVKISITTNRYLISGKNNDALSIFQLPKNPLIN